MKLIETTSFEKFMENYSNLTTNTENNNEIIIHKKEEKIDNKTIEKLTRRDFFKFSALSTAVILFPFTSEKAEANPMLWIIMALSITSCSDSKKSIEFKITLGNPNKYEGKTVKAHFTLGVTTKYNPKKQYAILDDAYETFYVPAGKACTYYCDTFKVSTNRTMYVSVKGNFDNLGTWYSSVIKVTP